MANVWSLLCVFLLTISSLLPHSIPASAPVINPAKVRQISWKPRAFVYEGFLTDLECDHLISIAKSELKRSAVADHESGESKLSEVRTSSGMFIHKAKDPIVSGIEDKIATWTFLPKENGEDIQVLRYEHGQKYEPHYDYFTDKINIARGGHRVATVLMYLSDVAKGGETVFPSAQEPLRRKGSKTNDLSECAKKGIAVKPRKGDALLFFSLHPKAQPDISSLHAGCPVIDGEKWSATKWIHVDSFDNRVEEGDNCNDRNESCERLLSENAPKTQITWLDLFIFLATVGRVADHVEEVNFFHNSLIYFSLFNPILIFIIIFYSPSPMREELVVCPE